MTVCLKGKVQSDNKNAQAMLPIRYFLYRCSEGIEDSISLPLRQRHKAVYNNRLKKKKVFR